MSARTGSSGRQDTGGFVAVTQVKAPAALDLRTAVACMPAFVVILFGGMAFGRMPVAVILAASAYSVAFGAAKRIGTGRWTAMVVTGGGMMLAAFAGTLAGLDPLVETVGTAVMAALAGALARRDGDRSWALLQLMIAFLLAAHFPGDVPEALRRAALVATGAAIQFGAVRIMVALRGELPMVATPPPVAATPRDVRLHALRAATCVTAALLASHLLGRSHGYWAPITAMLVLKPGLRNTWTRGIERLAGTMAGIVVATILVAAVEDRPGPVVAMTVVAAAASFGLQRARYPIFSSSVTTCVLLLLALGGAPVLATDVERLTATLLGGAIAFLGAAIAPRRPPAQRVTS